VINQTDNPNTADTQGGININFYMLTAPRTDLPRIDAVYPDGSTPMQQTNTFVFVASNPTYGIATSNIQVTLNGVNISSGLSFSGSSSSWNVSYPGLQPNTNYTAIINVTDNNNQTHNLTINFDTFSATNFTWEAEDFDFDAGNSPVPSGNGLRYIDNPVPTSAPATNSYYGQTGDLDIDYSSQFLNVLPVPAVYRSAAMNFNNVVPIEVTADANRQRTLNAQLTQVNPSILDYDIFNLTNSAWINYTHTFPAGNFYAYARMSAGTTNVVNVLLAQVTSGAGTSTQTTNVLGWFQATGNSYATWQYAPLINTNTGSTVILTNLGGVQTLQVTGDGFEHVNFFMLAPVSAASVGYAPTNSPVVTGFSLVSSGGGGGKNVVINGNNGDIGATYYLLSSTNLAKPLNQWQAVATNVLGSSSFTFIGTNAASAGGTQQFYILSSTNN